MPSCIELTKGKVSIVDDRFVSELSKHRWHVQESGGLCYAVRNCKNDDGKRGLSYLHIEVLKLAGIERLADTDHIDGDGLNNRLSNLRPCSHGENLRNKRKYKNNTSGFKGVSFCKRENRFRAVICVSDIYKSLGYFDTAEEAAVAYDEAAVRLHGEFARTN